MNFDIVKRAGVSQAQFASLVGVSRITVNTWFNGHFTPQARLRARVRKAIDLLSRAIDDGQLPVPQDHAKQELRNRLGVIESALRAEG